MKLQNKLALRWIIKSFFNKEAVNSLLLLSTIEIVVEMKQTKEFSSDHVKKIINKIFIKWKQLNKPRVSDFYIKLMDKDIDYTGTGALYSFELKDYNLCICIK